MQIDNVNTGVTGTIPYQQDQAPTPEPQPQPTQPTQPTQPEQQSGYAQGQSNPPNEQIQNSQDPEPQPPQPPALQAQLPQPAPVPPSPPTPKGVSPDNPNATHPMVQKAGLLHTVFQALAGGPRVTMKINPDTGEMVRTEAPLSRGDIAMAIALEALGGAAKGLGVAPGPGHEGRAAAAGFEQGVQQQQQIQQRKQQQATQDYARQVAITETNMKMYNNARQAGRLDMEANQKYIDSYKETNDLLDKSPGAVIATVGYADLGKYNATSQNAVPYSLVPRPDANDPSKQATDKLGTPMWDIQYRIVDPKYQSAISAQDKADGVKWGIRGLNDPNLPTDAKTRLLTSVAYRSQVAGMNLMDGELKDYYKTLGGRQQANNDPNQSIFNMFGDNEKLSAFIKGHEGSKPTDRSIRNNNEGNLVADASWTGPKDDTNLKDGQLPFRKYSTPEEGHDALLKQIDLMKSRDPNMTPEQFFAQYDKKDAAKYAADARHTAGAGAPDTAPQDKYTPVDLAEAAKADNRTAKAVSDYQGYRNKGDNESQSLAAFAAKNPEEGMIMYKLFGGVNAAKDYDNEKTLELQKSKDDEHITTASRQATAVAQAKAAEVKKMTDNVNSYLVPADPAKLRIPDNLMQMAPEDAIKTLQDQGVKVPPHFYDLWAIAHYDAPITSDAARVWMTGNPGEWDQATAIAYIKRFINPSYSTPTFDAYKKDWTEVHDGEKPKTGGAIVNAGVATQHLELLRQAGSLLHNGNSEALNHLANSIGVRWQGKNPAAVFDAIADFAADEVSKVGAGAQPFKTQVDGNRSHMNSDRSPAVIDGVINAWTDLMYGRIQQIDESVYKPYGKHLDNVSDEATELFQNAGHATPWAVQALPKGRGATLSLSNPQDTEVLHQFFMAAGGNTPVYANRQKAAVLATKWARQQGWVIDESQHGPTTPNVPQTKPAADTRRTAGGQSMQPDFVSPNETAFNNSAAQ